MFDKDEFKVNMNGKEYLDYKIYKDKKKKLSKKEKIGLLYIGLSILGIVLIISIWNSIFYVPPKPTSYTWEGILMFLAVCAGLGWVFHGTGFLIIRR